MSHTAPTNMDDYNKMFMENSQVTGYGIDAVTQHIPCPFCTAPDFFVILVVNAHAGLAEERTCSECGRSGKNIITRSANGTAFEFVQTGGDDAPEWLEPGPPRRLDDDDEVEDPQDDELVEG